MTTTKTANQTDNATQAKEAPEVTKLPTRVAQGAKTQAMPNGNPPKSEPKAKAKATKASKAKAAKPTKAKAKKTAPPQRAGSMAEFVDNLLLEGQTWDSLLAKAKAEAEKRGQKQFTTMGSLKSHVRFRSGQKQWKVTETKTKVSMSAVKK